MAVGLTFTVPAGTDPLPVRYVETGAIVDVYEIDTPYLNEFNELVAPIPAVLVEVATYQRADGTLIASVPVLSLDT